MGRDMKPTGVRVEKSYGPNFEVLGLPHSSPLFDTRAEAEAWAAKQVAKLPRNRQAGLRACLTCGKEFRSDGAHHRMCNACRVSARDDTGTFGFLGLSGGGRATNRRAGGRG